MATATSTRITADELSSKPDLGRCELIQGEVHAMSPASFEHGLLCMNVGRRIANFVAENDLGLVCGAETGFLIEREPDTVRAPDLAFLGRDRIPKVKPASFCPVPPDLAVEVLSPSDNASYVMEKTNQWLASGVQAVWIVDPKTKLLTSYRRRDSETTVTTSSSLEDVDLLPGFSMSAADIFTD